VSQDKVAALDEARAILRPLPTAEGGIIVVLATAGTPPAIAMLSSGDVLIGQDNKVLVGLHGDSSAGRRLGGAFSILVPSVNTALRLEVTQATARTIGGVVLLEGQAAGMRHTSEPPWAITMRFSPQSSEGIAEHVRYWREMRAWLEAGARGQTPSPPGRGGQRHR
jgi:hypothetical protein